MTYTLQQNYDDDLKYSLQKLQHRCYFKRIQQEKLYKQWSPDSKVHGAIMESIWGRQDPGGLHVGPVKFAIWDEFVRSESNVKQGIYDMGLGVFVTDTWITCIKSNLQSQFNTLNFCYSITIQHVWYVYYLKAFDSVNVKRLSLTEKDVRL